MTSCAAAGRTRSSWAPRSPTRGGCATATSWWRSATACRSWRRCGPASPMVCMVNHVHTDLWPLRFPPPLSTVGRFMEQRVMPWAPPPQPGAHGVRVDRAGTGVTGRGPRERIRLLHNGAAPAGPPAPRSAEPLFLALGRLAEYKRIDLLLRLWDRVRPVVGGRLVIAGEGPQRGYLESLAGPGVTFAGRVSEEEKHRLLGAAWLLRARRADRRLGDRGHRGGPPGHPRGRFRRPGTARLRRARADRPARPHRGGIRLGVGGAGPRPGAPRRHGRGRAAARLPAQMVDGGAVTSPRSSTRPRAADEAR